MYVSFKMDLALNDLQWCHKTKLNQTEIFDISAKYLESHRVVVIDSTVQIEYKTTSSREEKVFP